MHIWNHDHGVVVVVDVAVVVVDVAVVVDENDMLLLLCEKHFSKTEDKKKVNLVE